MKSGFANEEDVKIITRQIRERVGQVKRDREKKQVDGVKTLEVKTSSQHQAGSAAQPAVAFSLASQPASSIEQLSRSSSRVTIVPSLGYVSGGRVTNAVGTMFRKIFVGTRSRPI